MRKAVGTSVCATKREGTFRSWTERERETVVQREEGAIDCVLQVNLVRGKGELR